MEVTRAKGGHRHRSGPGTDGVCVCDHTEGTLGGTKPWTEACPQWLETNPKCVRSEDSVWLEITSGSKGLSDPFPVCLPGYPGSHFVVNSVPLTQKGFGTEVTLESVK